MLSFLCDLRSHFVVTDDLHPCGDNIEPSLTERLFEANHQLLAMHQQIQDHASKLQVPA
jgi:hypothetical protein